MRFIISTVGFIGIIGGLSLRYRTKIIDFILQRIHLPRLALAVLTFIFFAVVEENFNCPISGCALFPGFLFPYTVWYFLIIFGFELLLLKIFKKLNNFWVAVSIFGVLGIIVEFFLGSFAASILALPWWSIIITAIWIFATYGVIVTLPFSIYFKQIK